VTARRVLIAALLAASPLTAQQLAFTPYHANGTYTVRERIGWHVSVVPGQTAAGTYTYTVKRDGLAVIGTGTLDLTTGGGRATIETSLERPGMVLVEVRPPAGTPETGFHGASKAEVGRVLLGAAVAPLEIRPSAPRPSDFDDFWATQLRRLDSVPVEPELTPHESGRDGVDYFTIKMNNVGGAHVYGQLARPKAPAPGPFPALLILQWASPPYPLQREWVTDYAARGWLVLNVEPHDVPSDMPQAFYDALPQLIKDYRLIGRDSRDESYFLSMYLGDYRATEYLASRPDWDGRTLVIMGTSMGGQQGFAVAGLDSRVTALVAHVPAGCDFLGPLHGRAAPYPNWDVERQDVRTAAGYFDAVNFAPRIRARALISMGFIDETSPPAGIWAAFNELLGPKEAAPMVDSPHNHMATAAQMLPYTRRSAEWLDILARGGDPIVPEREPR